MIIIGLTGSIAMGKTEVAKVFREQGIPVFDADQEVHALYDSHQGATLLKHLAPQAVSELGVDRAKLSAAILEDKGLLEKIERVVHAEIATRRQRFVETSRTKGHDMVLIDVPLLFEKSVEKDVNVTVVVSAPLHLQRERALARPGMTAEKLELILARQMPDSEKRARADHVLENNATRDVLRARTLQLIEHLKQKMLPDA